MVLANCGSHTRKVDVSGHGEQCPCLLLCCCCVFEGAKVGRKKVSQHITVFHTSQSVQKHAVLLHHKGSQQKPPVEHSSACTELVEGSRCLCVRGSWGPDLQDLLLCISAHLGRARLVDRHFPGVAGHIDRVGVPQLKPA